MAYIWIIHALKPKLNWMKNRSIFCLFFFFSFFHNFTFGSTQYISCSIRNDQQIAEMDVHFEIFFSFSILNLMFALTHYTQNTEYISWRCDGWVWTKTGNIEKCIKFYCISFLFRIRCNECANKTALHICIEFIVANKNQTIFNAFGCHPGHCIKPI